MSIVIETFIEHIKQHKDEYSHIYCGIIAFASIVESEYYDIKNKTFYGIPCACKHPDKINANEILVVKKSTIEHIDINLKITNDGVEF